MLRAAWPGLPGPPHTVLCLGEAALLHTTLGAHKHPDTAQPLEQMEGEVSSLPQ